MKIQLLSDVHCEYLGDAGTKAFIEALDPSGVDVLVLAGDIGNAHTIGRNLAAFAERFRDAIVLFVCGNHELYGGTPQIVMDLIRVVEAKTPNLRVLDDQVTEIGGIVFAGTPLWYRRTPRVLALEPFWSDFRYIKGLRQWVYGRNRDSEHFLQRTLAGHPVDVVITHFLPSTKCITEKYRGNEANDLFVTPIADELEVLPRVWAYGHTHDPADFEHRGCRFVCNSFAYPHETKEKFRQKLLIELEPREVS